MGGCVGRAERRFCFRVSATVARRCCPRAPSRSRAPISCRAPAARSRATVTTGRAGRPDRRHAAWARTSAGERRAAVRGPDANAVPIPGPLDERLRSRARRCKRPLSGHRAACRPGMLHRRLLARSGGEHGHDGDARKLRRERSREPGASRGDDVAFPLTAPPAVAAAQNLLQASAPGSGTAASALTAPRWARRLRARWAHFFAFAQVRPQRPAFSPRAPAVELARDGPLGLGAGEAILELLADGAAGAEEQGSPPPRATARGCPRSRQWGALRVRA